MALHDGFRMYISPEAYTFEPISQSASEKGEILTIDRVKNAIRVDSTITADPSRREKVMTVYGILGLIALHTSEFLIVITSRTRVARLLGADIYLATDFRVFPVSRDATPSLLQHPVEKSLLAMLKAHLYSGPFYFSYQWDLTSSMQRQARNADSDKPMWERADDRFFWNRHLMSRFIDTTRSNPAQNLSRFILPAVFGFLEVKSCTVNGRDLLFGLVARRSRHRAGTRYFSRGIDKDGQVSNFNETEQFIVIDPPEDADRIGKVEGKIRMSYLQTRGSVPVYWAEVNNLRYKPDLQIMEKTETADATKRHFEEQVRTYGDVYIVNLVNQKGYEKPVKEAFERAVEMLNNPQVHYTYYDFHHECKGMHFERVWGLVERLQSKGLEADDYFHQDVTSPKSTVKRQQKAIVRTNCMDCLDRTNVVQSTLARWTLTEQLRSVGVLSKDERIDDKADFMHMFRNVWADHADVVSKAYSGTGALKTDFTRTGKRTKEGALQDGINSVTRYVKNNFLDGPRQDAYDLFTGAWQPGKQLPHVDQRALVLRAMPWIFFFSLVMMFCGAVLPRGSEIPLHNFVLFWFVVAAGSGYFIVDRGLDYVAWPTLNRPEESMNYDGPGFSSGRHGRASSARPSSCSASRKPPATTNANAGRRGGGYSLNEEKRAD